MVKPKYNTDHDPILIFPYKFCIFKICAIFINFVFLKYVQFLIRINVRRWYVNEMEVIFFVLKFLQVRNIPAESCTEFAYTSQLTL